MAQILILMFNKKRMSNGEIFLDKTIQNYQVVKTFMNSLW